MINLQLICIWHYWIWHFYSSFSKMRISMKREEKNVWLIHWYHNHVKYDDLELKQSLMWDVKTLIKILFQLKVMSMNEIYVNMTYEMKFSSMLNVYVCESCHRELKSTKTKISTNVYSCVMTLSIINRDHDNHVWKRVCEQDNSALLSYTTKYTRNSASLLAITEFSIYFIWCASWLSISEYYDERD